MRTVSVAVLLAALVALGGCGFGGTPGGAGLNAVSCADFDAGAACDEQAQLAASRHPGATQVELTCTARVCDRTGGSGTVVVTLANGAKVTEAFVYTGNVMPVPAPVCNGLPAPTCRKVADSIAEDQPPTKAIVSITVTCSVAPCVDAKGETEVRVRFADGTEFMSSFGWAGALP